MPRKYKPNANGRRYKKYPKEVIEEAVQEYCDGNGSLKSIAKKFEVNKSVLYRHCFQNMKKQGGQTVLSTETELGFIKYINLWAELGCLLGIEDLRLLVKHYLDKLGVTEKRFKDNMPSQEFARNFIKRHSDKLSHSVLQNIKRNRAAVSTENIKKNFEHLENPVSLWEIPISNVICDETSMVNDPDQIQIIPRKETEDTEEVVDLVSAV